MTIEVQLSNGDVALIDDADAKTVLQYDWRCLQIGNSDLKYAAAYDQGRHLLMHRLIMNPASEMVVDHVDHDGLNNIRANLRVCTQSQNIHGARPHKDGQSRFKGVHKNRGRWRAMIKAGGKSSHIGYFPTEQEAALAYDSAAVDEYGEFARTNRSLGLLKGGR